MRELKSICKQFENLTVAERTALLAESSIKVVAKLTVLDIPSIDPLGALSGFILGATVADGVLEEREYLLIYPSLVRVFGNDFDFVSVKESFNRDRSGKKAVKEYVNQLVQVLSFVDESVVEDVILLCLCVLSVDGKVTLRERSYLRKLLKAAC